MCVCGVEGVRIAYSIQLHESKAIVEKFQRIRMQGIGCKSEYYFKSRTDVKEWYV